MRQHLPRAREVLGSIPSITQTIKIDKLKKKNPIFNPKAHTIYDTIVCSLKEIMTNVHEVIAFFSQNIIATRKNTHYVVFTCV